MWADPVSKDVAQVFQAWAVLEAQHGTIQLARELFKCAVKANPQSEISWAVCVATSSHSVSSSQKVCYDELVNMFLPGLVMINAICQLSMFTRCALCLASISGARPLMNDTPRKHQVQQAFVNSAYTKQADVGVL